MIVYIYESSSSNIQSDLNVDLIVLDPLSISFYDDDDGDI